MDAGRLIFRFRWVVLSAWLAAGVLLALLVAPIDPSANEKASYLPAGTDYRLAVDAIQETFPNRSGLSKAVIVFERPRAELTPEDLETVERLAERLRKSAEVKDSPLAGAFVRSPRSIPLAKNPLISKSDDAGQAALVIVNIPFNFVTMRSAMAVDCIRDILAEMRKEKALPGGMEAAVTGSSGFGRDYALAVERSHERTLLVTVIAIIIILLVVYRAPVAALIPLGAIGVAVFVAMRLLAIGENIGMHIGTAERIFVFVLVYGAGTDYSLLLISRYREFLSAGAEAPAAAVGAMNATFSTILASAGTDAAGLLMLVFADFGIFQTTGPAVAISLMVAMLAALTLVPAMIGIIGPRLFWSVRTVRGAGGEQLGIGRQWLWPKVARVVVGRPALVLCITLAVLAVPAAQNLKLPWVYDTLTELKSNYGAVRGADMVKRHWPVGEIAPVTVLVRAADNAPTLAEWDKLCGKITAAVGGLEGVSDVRSLTQPVGKGSTLPSLKLLRAPALRATAREYIGRKRLAMRLEAVLDQPALTLEAMSTVQRIRQAVSDASAGDLQFEVHIAGATAEIIDIRTVTQRDFHRVAALSLGVIFLIVLVLLRDVILTAFMVASTVLSYLATLGISYWVFAGLFGAAGLDWKVEVFLFVVMVAVGVDYNIFLTARLRQEARTCDVAEATRRAIIHTGPVISSCGVIMAATLGSLCSGDLTLLVQLGFAFALGMLIDTFVVRPLLLPAFIVLTRHAGRRAW